MSLPGPIAVAKRLYSPLVGRPADALAPFLHESTPTEPTLLDEAMTLLAGAGSFAVLSAATAVFALVGTLYALCYPVASRVAAAVGRLRARVGR